jgi:CBS domain-containing protein
MNVRDVMTTDPSCCVPDDTVIRAARMMKFMDTGVVPVVESDRSRKLVGIVTDRDLCLAIVAEGQDPKSMHVQRCMTTAVVTCEPDESVETALALMRENQIRRLPVVDRQGYVEGIVSMADIVRMGEVHPDDMLETLKEISEPTDASSKPRETAAYRLPI